MDTGPLTRRILEDFDVLPPQLKAAARFVVDCPDDVALLSMREQARKAGVLPATMTRLAQRLGFAGYDAVRDLYAAAIRAGDLGFSGRAGRQVAAQREKGEAALATEFAAALCEGVERLRAPATLAALVEGAEMLSAARRIACLGLRASFPPAWTVRYLLGLFDDRAMLLDGGAGVMADRARDLGAADALLAFGFDPYSRDTVETAQRLAARGVPVVAVTDSAVSPLARAAQCAVLLGPDAAPSFFRAMTPALAAAEILAALVAGRGGEAALAALARTEAHLSACNVHWVDPESRRSS